MIEIAIVCALIALVILWNFYKPLRARMRGFSTIIEGAIGTLLIYMEIFSEAIQEGQGPGISARLDQPARTDFHFRLDRSETNSNQFDRRSSGRLEV